MPLSEYDPAERFVAGTVGPPGQRTFFLQARAGTRVTSVSLEKVQVSILAERVGDMLDGVEASGTLPDLPVEVLADADPLDTPIEDEFRVNTIALLWDQERRRVVIEAHDRDPDEPESGEGEPESLKVVLTVAQARAFAARALTVVAAGRPPCPFCGGPLDADGHICPRANGYKR